MQQLLPEWAEQEAILLAWPDMSTDWAPWLDEVRQTYLSLISEINAADVPVIILMQPYVIEEAQSLINKWNQSKPVQVTQLLILPADYNDTWFRDFGFLTCATDSGNRALDFDFNGWGNKFDASLDTQVTARYFASLLQHEPIKVNFTLEGGALEIDANGHLLSTQLCLSNPERNGNWDAEKHLSIFTEHLGATKISILQHGHLEGDDTDGHIDTLVRFTPNNSVVVQSCSNRPEDSHFAGLKALVEECQLRIKPEHIFELPLPSIFNDDKERLPASYANFLICNQHIFAPIYQESEDKTAIDTLKKAYPNFRIVPINCRSLVQQFGSLHCITMQVPCNTLKSEVITLAKSGIRIYEQA
ncbi:agmatine deiminase family protein [Alteromonas sp. a30]|uniref:agmatine deiminase family protein n=1 Tax=Alteromonas sp. a30 TaxID=2730917 RepID=UPI002282955B|nr:agmatine deiminase family protein [Alteromonas sp. a30]MCY7296322.1 agmatine deiminase family protein [Alteromonas sp. a30]